MQDAFATFRIPIEKIPEAKHWEVGGKYRLTADVEQVGINKERDYRIDEMPSTTSRKKREKPKYRTMVEFKVYDVANAKGEAIKKKLSR